MCSNLVVFSNPENVPVEKLSLTVTNAGVVQHIKALDTYWVDKRELLLYERPPSGSTLVLGAVDTWKLKMEGYLADLKWLLGLEHHRFWSTVLYHEGCMDMLVSFLQEASPPYLPPHESADVQKLYENIRKHVLIVFSRLVTNKESKSQWMSKEFLAEILYDKFIFTIPIIWDICLAYGADNSRHVSRLLESVLTIQPRYTGDAVNAVAFVKEAFKYIILQVNNDYDAVDPPNLPETFKGFSEIRRPTGSKGQDKLTFPVLSDLVLHLLDTAMTLRTFIESYPPSVEIFRKTNFVLSIVQMYEYGVPRLYAGLAETGDPASLARAAAEGHIEMARAELIDVFREMLAVYKNRIFSGEGSVGAEAEAYLSLALEALSERLFIKDYHACYPLHEDLDLLRQACPDIDSVKTDFILQAVYSDLDEPLPTRAPAPPAPPAANGTAEPTDYLDDRPGPSTDDIPDNVRQQSLISEVKDILPQLGDGFVLRCLQRYRFDAATVIACVLEDSLDGELRALDRSLPIIPADPVDQRYLATGIQRLNVFDGDQFDVMSRDDVDVSRMHVGKRRDKYRDLGEMLDDKTEVNRDDIYTKYNLVCDSAGMYSDEYDDTYDSDGAPPAPAPDADDARRPFVTPRALLARRDRESSSSEEEQPAEPAVGNRNRMDFCTNPEEVRARREAHMARRGRGSGPRPPPPRNTDVVGRAKGQGQEKEVLHNREKKEKHKSTRANHNRRSGAQWKRTQGMVPS